MIHAITGSAVQQEIPGLKEVHAVDAAGVHPLLLAVGSERYTPYAKTKQPAELLTIANHILGTGQLSLAKFLFITAADEQQVVAHDVKAFFIFMLERINLQRDLHFYTNTSIDTLDYSGTGLNMGSKIVLAAYGPPLRKLATSIPVFYESLDEYKEASLVMPGVIALKCNAFTTYEQTAKEMAKLDDQLKIHGENSNGAGEIVMIIVCDDPAFTSAQLNNFLWVTFTRSNPSHDIYGVDASTENKHWGCKGPVIFDARIKPHHAPAVEKDPATEKSIEHIFNKGGSLYRKL